MAQKKTFEFEGVEYKMPTDKEKKFCHNLIESSNQTESYVKAFKVKNRDSAKVRASMLLTKVNVRAYYDKLQQQYWKERHITTDEVVASLSAIIKSKVTDFATIEGKRRIVVKDLSKIPEDMIGAIKSMKQTDFGIELTFHDKLKAIDMALKMHGAYEKDNEQKRDNVVFLLPDNKRK